MTHTHAKRFCLVVLGLATALGFGCASSSKQEAFATPEAGVDAFIAALRPVNDARLDEILGPDGRESVQSGDAIDDRDRVETFLAAYDANHRVVTEGNDATLLVGANDWPMPIPLVKSRGGWRFDMDEGREEILARRIGRNELAAIETCRAIVDAQREYAATHGGAFAQKFLSDSGQRNGLYWPTGPGEPPSPLGPLVVEASDDGYALETGRVGADPAPFHGYRYRILTAQGPSGPGGARDYIVNGRMTGGFGVLAWPVEYESSGIMTFIVGRQGVVFEKDLGRRTDAIAGGDGVFDPGTGWSVVEEPD